MVLRCAVALLVLGACQDDISTPFPEGLEPFVDDAAAEVDAPVAESVVTTGNETNGVRVYGRGYVFAPVDEVWAAAQVPENLVARCQTDEQRIARAVDPMFAVDFDVHYVVNDIVTVEWDDRWRGDVVVPGERIMIKHQKIEGSDFINLSEGSTQIIATDDPGVTELQFVEHLMAFSGDTDEVAQGTRDSFDAIVAAVHGRSLPACVR